MVEIIIFLYVFFKGGVYTSWMWDTTDSFGWKCFYICFGFVTGWLNTKKEKNERLV